MNNKAKRISAALLSFLIIVNLFAIGAFAADADGYDIVLALDESTSMSKEESQLRNEAAKLFCKTLTDDCNMGLFYFTKGVNEGTDVLPLNSANNRSTLNSTLDRIDRTHDDGTDICNAVDHAVEMLGDSKREKAIILFTDGLNFVNKYKTGPQCNEAKTKELNKATKQRILETKTEDHNEAIPLYVVYLETSKDRAKNSKKMLDLFTVDGYKPQAIDARNNDKELSESSFNDPSQTKIIYIDDASDLVDVLPKLFYKIKNIGFKNFEKKPDKNNNGYATVACDIPDFGVSRLQFTVTSKAAFTVGKVFPADNSSAGVDFSELGEQAAKTTQIFTVNDGSFSNSGDDPYTKSASLTPGKWQIEFYGTKDIKGTVSMVADFDGEVKLIEDGKTATAPECGTEVTFETKLKKGTVSSIHVPDNSEAELIIDSLGIKQSVKGNGEKYIFEPITFKAAGSYPYTVRVTYADLSYDINRVVEVCDNAPKKAAHLPKIVFYDKDNIAPDGLIDIGAVDGFIYDKNDKESLNVAFSSDLCECAVMSVEEAVEPAADEGTQSAEDIQTVEKLHLFVTEQGLKAQHLAASAIDSAGNEVSYTYTVKTIEKGRFIMENVLIVLAILLIAAGIIFAIWFIRKKQGDKDAEKSPQEYSAYIAVEKNSNGDPYYFAAEKPIVEIPAALYELNKYKGFTFDGKEQNGILPLNLVLCGGKVVVKTDKKSGGKVAKSQERLPYIESKSKTKFKIKPLSNTVAQADNKECTRYQFKNAAHGQKYIGEVNGVKFIIWVGKPDDFDNAWLNEDYKF